MTATRRTSRPSSRWTAPRGVLSFVVAFAIGAAPALAGAQLARSLPESFTDHEFWQFFTTMSEEGGSFVSENFVSNEQTYQNVIPTLQRSLTPNGVYLGVGPEQNFTYIANLRPKMAIIFDIRRQNAMAHLMYKALFELSPTRAEFVAKLFSRPLPSSIGVLSSPAELFTAAANAPRSDSAFQANRKAILDHLVIRHNFALTAADVRAIDYLFETFAEAGTGINYGYRAGGFGFMGPNYATYAQIQNLTNAQGINMAFLANEENYQWIRGLHSKNLVIPVVGDFAGPKAIRSVGEYLKQRKATVTAFYLSNVEQYLFRQSRDAENFYHNVEALPIDSTSTFIRSVPSIGGGPANVATRIFNGSGFIAPSSTNYSVSIIDSGGVSVIYTTRDSAGKLVTTRSVDSSRTRKQSPLEIFRSLRARDDSIARASAAGGGAPSSGVMVLGRDTIPYTNGVPRIVVNGSGGGLVSGLAPIRTSLEEFIAGRLSSYNQAIAMTKTDGWK